ncbi:hypothetical protein SD70_32055 [Gordoniibacillus kamchatkensis]|uniref:Uncharacterized protein n=2 Tax=Gordoniibacillus kamchatkensis TaxID=1590651 RepID=A0ABR5A3J5_9BACL|nr:hypothetical protein SD70_32055 [Paenibacillus sp. VKM B-2647]
MEFVLRNTDIFDPTLAEKFETVILNESHQFEAEKVFKFIASFHVDLIKDLSSFDRFILPVSDKINKRKKSDEKDKMYDVLGFQLKQLENILMKNNIKFYSSTIQGDQLESTHIIKIEIEEDKSERVITKNSRKHQLGKVSSVVPSKLYTENLVSKLASERISELYYKIFNVIGNKKIMSEILGIDETENDNVLFQAFVKEYGELWLTTKAIENELFDKLIRKTTEVFEKYIQECEVNKDENK